MACIVFSVMYNWLMSINTNIPDHRRQTWLKSINWDKNRTEHTGEGVAIAVIDTGVDSSVEEYKDNIIEEISTVDYKDKGNTEHGSAVSSIIVGSPKYDKGVLGVATSASITSIDVTNDENGIVEVENLIKGIEIAADRDVDIINISIGCIDDSKELREAVDYAYNKGIIIVASAGNYMTNECLYPAAYDNVIAVGSLNKKGEIESPQVSKKSSMIYLPGTNIVASTGKNNYVGTYGTSFSCAICTGLVALIIESGEGQYSADDILMYFKDKGIIKGIDFVTTLEQLSRLIVSK